MMNPTLHTWEHLRCPVTTGPGARFAVPGGWLYQLNAAPDILVYVPDPAAPHVVWETPEAAAQRERERDVAAREAVESHLREHWETDTSFDKRRIYRFGKMMVAEINPNWLFVRDDHGVEHCTNLRGDAITATASVWTHPAVAPLVAIIRQDSP